MEWCQSVGLIPTRRNCPKNCGFMRIEASSSANAGVDTCIGLNFRCRKGKHDIKRTLAENTWFERRHITIENLLIATYVFSWGGKYTDVIRETSMDDNQTSCETVAKTFSSAREVCMVALEEMYDSKDNRGKLSGVVAIDETKIGKRKFECGRLVEGSWILGIIESGSKEFRLEICPGNSRSAATLLPLIQKHVELGSTIVTDKWAGYNCLKDNGYLHLTVNHSDNFVDPNTGAHTQNIECEWRPLKHRISRGGVHTKYLADHLCEYLWLREISRKNQDPFAELLKAIRRIYPGFGH